MLDDNPLYRPDTTHSYLYELRMLWSAHYPALDLTHGIHFVGYITLSVYTKWSNIYQMKTFEHILGFRF